MQQVQPEPMHQLAWQRQPVQPEQQQPEQQRQPEQQQVRWCQQVQLQQEQQQELRPVLPLLSCRMRPA